MSENTSSHCELAEDVLFSLYHDVLGSDVKPIAGETEARRTCFLLHSKNVYCAVSAVSGHNRQADLVTLSTLKNIPVAREKFGQDVIDLTVLPLYPRLNVLYKTEGPTSSRLGFPITLPAGKLRTRSSLAALSLSISDLRRQIACLSIARW
ncbi:hypothetical protein J6590_041128 [Homalodisca vitripennis]|nr:hypothetical protein J6590_041128 [Homalodisca vitripennis]